MSAARTCNVSVAGPPGARPMVFVHGFGCDQHMWRHVFPAFEQDYRVVLLDLVGAGGSDLAAYDEERHATLHGHAADVLDVLHELELQDVVLVGHSVAAMIGVLAHIAEPDTISRLVLITPSARYLDTDSYTGGFSESDIDDLLNLMASNHLGWQGPLSALVLPPTERPEAAAEVEQSFCRTRPDIAAHFAKVTFLSDNRADLPHVSAPTLVIQSRVDAIAPPSAVKFVCDTIAEASLEAVDTTGHCPHLSAPGATVAAIQRFLRP